MPPERPTHVWAFLCVLGQHGVWYLTSSGVAAVLGVIERALGRPVSSWVFWAIALAGLFWACYRAWRDERRLRVELERRETHRAEGGLALTTLIAEGNELQMAFGKAVSTAANRKDRLVQQRRQLRAWGARVKVFLDARCPEYTPDFGRGITVHGNGETEPADYLGILLDRLVDIQRQLLSTLPSTSSRPS